MVYGYGIQYRPYGSFQKSEDLTETPNGMALIMGTPTKRTLNLLKQPRLSGTSSLGKGRANLVGARSGGPHHNLW